MGDRQYYKLAADGQTPVACSLVEYARWADTDKARGERRVGRAVVGRHAIWTSFLGQDHNWGDGPPVLWETLIRGDSRVDDGLDGRMWRYTSHAAAVRGHAAAAAMVRALYELEKPVT